MKSAASGAPKPRAVVLLGAQRISPSLPGAVAALDVAGPVAVITAGWQEREDEDDELARDLQGRAVNLRLYARSREVFEADPELAAAHRRKQTQLREVQELYRIRLECALSALQRVSDRECSDPLEIDVVAEALEAVRELDRRHLERRALVQAEFDRRLKPRQRPALSKHIKQLRKLMEGCEALAIAGGHIATLTNRLRLFGVAEMIGERAVFAWSGGAMCCGEKIVLFHEDTAQGPLPSEVFSQGIGLVPGLTLFPQPEQRLNLNDQARVSRKARRFAPSLCVALPASSQVIWQRAGGFVHTHDALLMREDGEYCAFNMRGLP